MEKNNIVFSVFMLFIGFLIINSKSIIGLKGAPDLYLGNWSYFVGGLFVFYGIYVLISIKD